MKNKLLIALIPLLLVGMSCDGKEDGSSEEIEYYPDVSYGYSTYENRGFYISWYDKTTYKKGDEVEYTVWYPYKIGASVLIYEGVIDYSLVEQYKISNNMLFVQDNTFTIVIRKK